MYEIKLTLIAKYVSQNTLEYFFCQYGHWAEGGGKKVAGAQGFM